MPEQGAVFAPVAAACGAVRCGIQPEKGRERSVSCRIGRGDLDLVHRKGKGDFRSKTWFREKGKGDFSNETYFI